MTKEERTNALPTQDEGHSSLPAPQDIEDIDGAELQLRMQYFGAVAVPSAVVLELLGAQLPGIGLALGTGVAAAYFAKEIHYGLEPVLKTAGKLLGAATGRSGSRRTSHRLLNRDWWLGQEVVPYAEEEEESGEGGADHKESVRPVGARNGKVIVLADDLVLPVSDLVGKAIFVCGIRRHGKTTLGARLAEQFGKFSIPMFIPDLEGDYISLGDVLPKAIIAGHPSADQQYLDYDFVALGTTQAAYQLGYDLLESGCQVILDMVSYPVLDQAVAVQVNIIRGMFRWANEHTSGRVPAYVYLDEAQRFLPQALNDSVIKNKDLIQALLDAYMDIIAIGGKRGINPVVLTQRFAQVNNKIMAQSEVFFLMRQTHDTDLKRCMEYANPPITKDQISKLKPGEGIYIATDGTQIVTQFQQRASSGKRSSTPQADAAQRYTDQPVRLGNGSFTPEEMELPVYKKRPTAVPTAPTTSFSPSENAARLRLVESERNTITSGTKDSEGALPLRQLSELEMRVEELFLEKKMNPAAIVRELWPDIKGGDAYQKKSIEVADAIRAIFEVRRGA